MDEKNRVSRREFLRMAGIAGVAVGAGAGLGGLVAACGETETTTTTTAAPTTTTGASTTTTVAASTTTASTGPEAGREIKVGYVTPVTGPLAAFGEADAYCISRWEDAVADGVLSGDGKLHPVKIIARDSQSDSNRAAQVAGDLINNEKVDAMMAASTADTTIPVSDTCEASGMPCVCTDTPWQPWFFGRNGNPAVGFKWTYLSFWGIEDGLINATATWDQIPTNKKVGVLWSNSADGLASADPEQGWPPFMTKTGYTIVDPGRYQEGSEDYTAEISLFKKEGCELVAGTMSPPDMITFLNQAAQQGLAPKVATIERASLFPSVMEATGTTGYGITNGSWWHPTYPFKSSLTGETCEQMAADYEAETGKQWTQALLHYQVFEIVANALKATKDIEKKEDIAAAVKAGVLDTLVGTVDFSKGPMPNVSKTPLTEGQWVPGTKWKYDLVLVNNATAPMITVQSKVQPMSAFPRS
jgi:branched-chain amino acid transport system substrate-binding protein